MRKLYLMLTLAVGLHCDTDIFSVENGSMQPRGKPNDPCKCCSSPYGCGKPGPAPPTPPVPPELPSCEPPNPCEQVP